MIGAVAGCVCAASNVTAFAGTHCQRSATNLKRQASATYAGSCCGLGLVVADQAHLAVSFEVHAFDVGEIVDTLVPDLRV